MNYKTLVFPLISLTKNQHPSLQSIHILCNVLSQYENQFNSNKQDSEQCYKAALVVKRREKGIISEIATEYRSYLKLLVQTDDKSQQTIPVTDLLQKELLQRKQSFFVCNEVNSRFESINDWNLMRLDNSILERAKSQCKVAKVTEVYPIGVTDDSKLKEFGISYIFHVCVPEESNSIQNQEDINSLLAKTYHNIFEVFFEYARRDTNLTTETKTYTSNYSVFASFPKFDPPPDRFGTSHKNWRNALTDIVRNPDTEENKRKTFYRDDKCIVIYDAYPKSKVHLLCIAVPEVNLLADLNRNHLPLLYHMKKVIQAIISHLQTVFPGMKFKSGCHALPSLYRLHIHINSCDFITPCVKNKNHYNSFCTPFYIPIQTIIQQLEQNGKLSIDEKRMESYLKEDLKCHICQQKMRNLPTLKFHIESCLKNRQ